LQPLAGHQSSCRTTTCWVIVNLDTGRTTDSSQLRTVGDPAFPNCNDCSCKNAEHYDVINNIVFIQIATENLFVLLIISWPLIHYYSDCTVTAVLTHYPL